MNGNMLKKLALFYKFMVKPRMPKVKQSTVTSFVNSFYNA